MRNFRRCLLAFGAATALAACGQSLTTGVQEAQLAYGIAKGVAQQAVLANPSLQPVVSQIEAQADPIAQAVSADTAPTLASLAQDLLTGTAQDVKVVPGTASPAPASSAPAATPAAATPSRAPS